MGDSIPKTIDSVLSEMKSENYKDKDLAKIIATLRVRLDEEDAKLNSKNREIGNLKTQLKVKENENINQNNDLKNQIDILNKTISDLKKSNKRLSNRNKELEEKVSDRDFNIRKEDTLLVGLEQVNKDLESEVEYLKNYVVKLEQVNKELEEYKASYKKPTPPGKHHKKGTEEFYRDLVECSNLSENKVDKNGKPYVDWRVVMKALKEKPTVMNYVESNNVKLTIDNVKRWLRVAAGDTSIKTKDYNKVKGYKK